MKVTFDNYGDDDESETVRVSVRFYVSDLVRDDDYEDAEVTSYDSFNLIKCYNDLC